MKTRSASKVSDGCTRNRWDCCCVKGLSMLRDLGRDRTDIWDIMKNGISSVERIKGSVEEIFDLRVGQTKHLIMEHVNIVC